MRAILVLTLAFALVGGAATLVPTASADITFGFDWSGDRDCNDPGETIVIPAPIHRHSPCAVLA